MSTSPALVAHRTTHPRLPVRARVTWPPARCWPRYRRCAGARGHGLATRRSIYARRRLLLVRLRRSADTAGPSLPQPARSKRTNHRAWIRCGDPQQGSGRTVRYTATLFPVPERRHTHANEESKLRLRLPEIPSDDADVLCLEVEDSGRSSATPPGRARLADAGDQAVEVLVLHRNSSCAPRGRRLSERPWPPGSRARRARASPACRDGAPRAGPARR